MESREEMQARVAGERIVRPGHGYVSKTAAVYLVGPGSGPGGLPVNRKERRRAERERRKAESRAAEHARR
ncbi:hypothetical protein ACPC54_18675 [Kitasatospora sp. NPDC094028]